MSGGVRALVSADGGREGGQREFLKGGQESPLEDDRSIHGKEKDSNNNNCRKGIRLHESRLPTSALSKYRRKGKGDNSVNISFTSKREAHHRHPEGGRACPTPYWGLSRKREKKKAMMPSLPRGKTFSTKGPGLQDCP